LSSSPVAIIVVVVSCRAIASRTVAIVLVARRAVAIIVTHRALAIIVDNGEMSVHRRTKVAVNGVFFLLTGVGGDGRRRAANDGGDDAQRTTPGWQQRGVRCSCVRRGVRCSCMRRRAANDGGDDAQRTTPGRQRCRAETAAACGGRAVAA
jgi:hypothetical protein